MFSATFIALAAGIVNILHYIKGQIIARAVNLAGSDSTLLYSTMGEESSDLLKLGEDAVRAGASSAYNQAPIANVPLANQTAQQLSSALVENSNIKGVLNNGISAENIDWDVASFNVYGRVNETYKFVVDKTSQLKDHMLDNDMVAGSTADGVSESAAGNVPSHMVAVVHDPAFQWIAITCIVVFGFLISISIWRYWKNKKSKL
jgi:hypothetical protein